MIPDQPLSIKIVGATAADANDIAGLLRASWAATYGSFLTPDDLSTVSREWHHPDIVRRQISDPNVLFLVARTDTGILVGIATAMASGDGAILSMLRLYVLPDYQGQGIGSQLFNGAVAAFPKARQIQLQVAEGNPSGLSFWTKRGFRACGHDEARVGDTTLALISMERTLQPNEEL